VETKDLGVSIITIRAPNIYEALKEGCCHGAYTAIGAYVVFALHHYQSPQSHLCIICAMTLIEIVSFSLLCCVLYRKIYPKLPRPSNTVKRSCPAHQPRSQSVREPQVATVLVPEEAALGPAAMLSPASSTADCSPSPASRMMPRKKKNELIVAQLAIVSTESDGTVSWLLVQVLRAEGLALEEVECIQGHGPRSSVPSIAGRHQECCTREHSKGK